MTDLANNLVSILADGEFHSGEELGERLNVTRAAIWKQIQKLSEWSLVVESIKGRGYRIAGGLELLDKVEIESSISAKSYSLISKLEILQTVDSTNSLAKQYAEQGNATGLVILAERQTAGRGRRGRSWVSPFARNIYLSVVWGFDGGAASLEGLSLAVGVAVKRAAEACGLKGVSLKWPNDVLVGQSKLGGILLEMTGDPAGFCQVVVGVGLNVAMPIEGAEEITQRWTDLQKAGGNKPSRNKVASVLLNELLALLGDYQSVGFEKYREEWQANDAFKDQPVKLVTPNQEVTGMARGVAENGALRLEVDGEVRSFNGGEISLRGAD